MASSSSSERKKKRKRKDLVLVERKLLQGETVEVRSTEEGFEGSWHPATILKCDDSVRLVRYHHIILDDHSDYYTDLIQVPPAIEGIVSPVPPNNRNSIRPTPPHFPIHQWALHYGLCVDALVNDAWWEGVIFDHDDGSNHRLVFFPDRGDQELTSIHNLRITQDWNEASRHWDIRGIWLFFQLIEEHDQECPLFVSVRQLWYDLRLKQAFTTHIKEWTSCWGVKSIWDALLLEVIHDNVLLTADYGLSLIEGSSKRRMGPRTSSTSIFSQNQPDLLPAHAHSTPIKAEVSAHVVPGGQAQKKTILRFKLRGKDGNSKYWDLASVGISEDPCVPKAIDSNSLPHVVSCADHRKDLIDFGSKKRVVRDSLTPCWGIDLSSNDPYDQPETSKSEQGKWLPAVPVILPGPKYCPDALHNYFRAAGRKRFTIATKVRMHLLSIGWKVDYKKDKQKSGTTMDRYRYTNPQGSSFSSIPQVYDHLRRTLRNVPILSFQNMHRSLIHIPVGKICSRVHHVPSTKFSDGDQGSAFAAPRKALVINQFKKEAGYMRGISPIAETLLLELPEGEVTPEDADNEIESCRQAVADVYNLGPRVKKNVDHPKGFVDSLHAKARKYLSDSGWSFRHLYKKGKQEFSYYSPTGRCYHSLRSACKGCMDEEGLSESIRPMEGIVPHKKVKGLLTGDNTSSAIVSTECFENIHPINGVSLQSSRGPSSFGVLEFGDVQVKRVRGPRKRRKDIIGPFPSRLHSSHASDSLYVVKDGTQVQTFVHGVRSQEFKKRKKSRALQRHGNQTYRTHVLRSSKRARNVMESNLACYTPRNILSWLIDNNIVLPRAKVCYMNTKNERTAEGRITRDGIRCNCCQKVFCLSRFEVHAGSTKRRPTANIYLEDGRSILQCQQQMMQDNKPKNYKPEQCQGTKSKSDCICSVCHYGGKLLLCDQCPSSFHLSCIGLESKALPRGKWFCPSCRCGICGESEFNGDDGQFTEKTVLCCDQCERKYHVECLRKTRFMKLNNCPEGNWFCSKKCAKIFMGLYKLLGKPNLVGVDNLSWTVFKSLKDGYPKDAVDMETMTEYHSKLNVALTVMHECFEPIKDTETKDLVKDVIFNKRSPLKRLNFKGFYTVLLEKEDELISVAIFRVFGEKVAEVPLIGTRVQLRRLGMCRILMNALEKKLTDLGVERLILPAIPQVLHAWTTSFGFSKMTRSERLEFLQYTFLDFPDTIMCQKNLMPSRTKVTARRAYDHRLVSEVLVAQDDEQIEVGEQFPVDICVEVTAGDNCNRVEMDPIHVKRGNDHHQPAKGFGIGGKHSDTKDCFKYYRRRKNLQQHNYDSFSHPLTTKQIVRT